MPRARAMPPIVFIHGAFSHAGHFGGWARLLGQAGFACRALSLPGHEPGAPRLLASLTMADYLAAVRRECARLTEPPMAWREGPEPCADVLVVPIAVTLFADLAITLPCVSGCA